MVKRELIDVFCEIKGETPKAYKITDGVKTVWVPKSQVEHDGNGVFTMPEWLAKEKELI